MMYISSLYYTAFLTTATCINAFAPSLTTSTTSLQSSSTTRYYDTQLAAAGTLMLDGQEIRGPITPLGNFVLVRTKDTLSATGGGILLPDQSIERPTEGEVIAAGPGKLHPHTGVRIHNPVSQGMSVLYGKFDGSPLNYDDEQMQMIRDDDVILFYTGVKMTKENVTPCRDYVLVKLDKENFETESGIVVAAAVTKDDINCVGQVFKVGEGRMSSMGQFTPTPVSVGERVKFKDYAGNEIKIDGEEYSLVRMVDILCSSATESSEE